MTDKTRNILIGILIVGLVSMTIVYAALSQTLSVSGSGRVQAGTATWNVHFSNLGVAHTSGTAVIGHDLEITGSNSLGNLEAVFSAKGDSIYYTFDIVNSGELPAKISNVVYPNLNTANYTNGSQEDQNIMKPNVQYSLTYTSSGNPVNVNDVINSGQTVNITFTVTYKSSASSTPDNDVQIEGLVTSIEFIQN